MATHEEEETKDADRRWTEHKGESEEEEEEKDDDAIRRMRLAFPYVVRTRRATDERALRRHTKKRLQVAYENTRLAVPPADRGDIVPWPYFFAHPPDERGGDDNYVSPLQQRFLLAFAADNRALLVAWMDACRAVFARVDRRVDDAYIEQWSGVMVTPIRSVLLEHPDVGRLTDLASLLPIVARELAKARATVAAAAAAAAASVALDHRLLVMCWDFYMRMFMPGSDRLGVPLPTGLVLFEGRSTTSASLTRPSAASILHDRVRRAPFSTSWHIDVALAFTDVRWSRKKAYTSGGTLLVHKVMSDAILGVDAQQARSTFAAHRSQRLGSWSECEIIVQPLVSFHRVHEADMLLDHWAGTHWVHVVFTHAFLGDVCPCEAQAEAIALAATTATAVADPDVDASAPKRQRLAGRLQLD